MRAAEGDGEDEVAGAARCRVERAGCLFCSYRDARRLSSIGVRGGSGVQDAEDK